VKLIPSVRTQIAGLPRFNHSARLFLLATFTNGITYATWILFFNLFLLARGYGQAFLGQANTAPALAALLLGFPLGLLSDRIGRKRAMLLGIILLTLGMGFQVIFQSPVFILAMGFLWGMGSSLFFVSQAPFMMKLSDPDNRAMLFSFNFGLFPLAGVIGNALAGQLPGLYSRVLDFAVGSAAAYQAVLLTSVIVGALALLPLLLIHEPHSAPAPTHKTREKAPAWRVLTRSLTVRLALPNLLVGFGAALLIPYMNVYFVKRFAMSDQNLGWLFSAAEVFTALGSFLAPRLSLSLGSLIGTVVLTQSGGLVSLVGLGLSPWVGLAALRFLVRSALMNMSVPLYDAFAMEQVPENEQATVNSVKNLAWNLGGAIGPFISGLVQQYYGFTPLFISTSFLYALATAFIWFLLRPLEKRNKLPTPLPAS
jgi:MFS family permease